VALAAGVSRAAGNAGFSDKFERMYNLKEKLGGVLMLLGSEMATHRLGTEVPVGRITARERSAARKGRTRRNRRTSAPRWPPLRRHRPADVSPLQYQDFCP